MLARANAITNQCYVINPNAVVTIGGGRSIGVDPEGRVLFEGGSGEEFMPEVLDLDRVQTVRERGTQGVEPGAASRAGCTACRVRRLRRPRPGLTAPRSGRPAHPHGTPTPSHRRAPRQHLGERRPVRTLVPELQHQRLEVRRLREVERSGERTRLLVAIGQWLEPVEVLDEPQDGRELVVGVVDVSAVRARRPCACTAR